jgi:hypothetical protein
MKIIKFPKAPEKFKHYANMALNGLVCFMFGAIAMNEYNYKFVYKAIAEAANSDTAGSLAASAAQKINEGDKSQKSVLEFLAKKGSNVAYFFLTNDMRKEAFVLSRGELKRNTPETIEAADTHAADVLLLEAMDNLSNRDLIWLLDVNKRLFDQKIRFETRKRIEANDYASDNLRLYDLTQMQTSLTELERSKIQECAQKLHAARDKNEAGDGQDWHKEGLCSKETNYRAYDTRYWIDRSLFIRALEISN